MIGFYLGEEPLLPSVETLDLGDPDALARGARRLDELVVKERSGEGGYGVTIFAARAARATSASRCARDLRTRPAATSSPSGA